MTDNFFRGMKFAIPISLILWSLIAWPVYSYLQPHEPRTLENG